MTKDSLLPLGQKPEGELNSLVRMQNAFNRLMSSMKLLQENIDKLKEENKRLKDTLGIIETTEPLVLTSDMEVKDGHQNKLKVLDLFSGIGGFSLGLHSTGIFDTVKFVEFDKFCQKVLQKNFPDVPIEGDIRDVKGEEFEADVITGGFPCQPFSVAGKQKGTNDNRYLWPEMFRLIKKIKPEFVIGENVQGLINLQNGMVLRQVQDQLESEGFEVQCFLIPASGIGAWHQRNRVWIVGHSKHNGLLASESRGKFQTTNKKWSEKKQETTCKFKRANRSSSSEVGNRSKTGIEQSSERKMDGNVPTISKNQMKLYPKSMYPTPSASCQMDVVAPPETVKRNSSGWSVTRVGTGRKFGAKLNDVVNKGISISTTWKEEIKQQ
jgi:DNA-cytosine methyltransferase